MVINPNFSRSIKKRLTCNFFRNGKIFGIKTIIPSIFFLLGFIIFCNIKSFFLYVYMYISIRLISFRFNKKY